jgi:hypothetical protein
VTVKTDRLIQAIRLVTEDHDWEVGEAPDPIVATMHARETLNVDEVTFWMSDNYVTEQLGEAYLEVLSASHQDISAALRGA